MQRLIVCAVSIVTLALSSLAAASTWEIDPAHTSAQFAVRHLMVSTVRGTMGKVSGTVNLDETDPTKSSVEATVDVTGLDTREPKRDQHLKSPDFFDVAKYPTITFKSKKITKVSDTKFQVTGDLTIHGVTKRVTAPVRVTSIPESELTKASRGPGDWIHATTEFAIKLSDFGIEVPQTLGMKLSNDVKVRIDVFANGK